MIIIIVFHYTLMILFLYLDLYLNFDVSVSSIIKEFDNFSSLSGYKINWSKSALMQINNVNVTNRGHEHCSTHHQMSLFHHRTFTHLQITLRLHFPSFTAPTQLSTIITLAPVHYHPITHTLYKPWTFCHTLPSIV